MTQKKNITNKITDSTGHLNFLKTEITSEDQEPQSFKSAINGSQKDKWNEAIYSEYTSLIDNETWTAIKLPEGKM